MSSASSILAGELLVVSTPLGNPGDFSPRAREALTLADAVLAEDTRRAGLLLAGGGLGVRRLISLHEHNEESRLPALMEELAQGHTLALISDAGTPLLSDPGYKLVRACRAAGYKVRPLPGPCAALAALAVSGLPPQPFVFLGFPPRTPGGRRRFFAPFAALPVTLVFFERKDRLLPTLELLRSLGGGREICLAREMTKTHEEFIFFALDEAWPPLDLLGEITVVAGPPAGLRRLSEPDLRVLIERIRGAGGAGVKPRVLSRLAAEKAPGWSAGEIYRLLACREPEQE